MTWMDFWDALERNRALPSAGVALLTFAATFRWLEPCSDSSNAPLGGTDPFAAALDWIARLRAAGDEAAARRAENRLRDERRRLVRYGQAMMIVGALIVVLSLL